MLDNPFTRIVVAIAILAVVMGVLPLFFPALPLPPVFATGLNFLFTNLWKFNYIFPVSDMIFLAYMALTLELIIIAVRVILWLFYFLMPHAKK